MTDAKLTIADAEKRKVPCEVYSRVVGYLRPVSAYNIGKQQEFVDRVVFKQPAAPALSARIKAVQPSTNPDGFWLPEDWAG